MAKVNGKAIGLLEYSKSYLNREIVRNKFSSTSEYRSGSKEALSPIGKGENNGQVGDIDDITERNKELVRNTFTKDNPYDSSKT